MHDVQMVIMPGFSFPAALLDEIRAVDPRLHMHAGPPAERALWRRRGDEGDPEVRALFDTVARAEVIVAGFDLSPDLPQLAPNLRWLHTPFAGVERVFAMNLVDRGFTITNGSGPAATPIAEWVLMGMLMLAKDASAYLRSQQQHEWKRRDGFELGGKSVGIVGLGAIGREVARLARPFGLRTLGIRRSAAEARADADGVDLLLPPSGLPRLLAESDFVVVAAPSTNATAALIDATALAQMRPGSYLINVARGALVDERALVAALQSGHLAGAMLDVFEREPLPADSPLWDLPNVIVTPHNSPVSQHFQRRQVELIIENLRAYLAGNLAGMANIVTVDRGY